MRTISFPYKHTGKPRITYYFSDGSIAVALQFTENVNGRNLKRYRVGYYDISNNAHLRQALSTENYIGQEDILNNTISLEQFNNSRTGICKRI